MMASKSKLKHRLLLKLPKPTRLKMPMYQAPMAAQSRFQSSTKRLLPKRQSRKRSSTQSSLPRHMSWKAASWHSLLSASLFFSLVRGTTPCLPNSGTKFHCLSSVSSLLTLEWRMAKSRSTSSKFCFYSHQHLLTYYFYLGKRAGLSTLSTLLAARTASTHSTSWTLTSVTVSSQDMFWE